MSRHFSFNKILNDYDMTFKQSPPGFKNINGPLIEEIQTALTAQGYSTQGVDGIWGNKTALALGRWQTAKGMAPTEIVDDATWAGLINNPSPPLAQRALQLTGDWEGTHYGGANGNFDGQGITWGVVGFTWGNGELQGILSEIDTQYSNLFNLAFGAGAGQMRNILGMSLPAQMTWARSISAAGGNSIVQPWSDAFAELGTFPEVQDIENEHAQHYWNAGLHFAQTFGLQSEAGLALCFDIAVQDSVSDALIAQIQQQLGACAGNESAMMKVIASEIANEANPKYQAVVLARKMTFATGQGLVNGDNYDIRCWGIG